MKDSARLHLAFCCTVLLASAPARAQDSTTEPAPVQGMTISGAELTEDSCEVLAATKGKKSELREVPGMHVLGRAETDPLVLHSTPEVKLSAVMCWRSEARLAPNDYLVPHTTGVPLYIKTDTGDEAADRTIALEEVNGGIRVRLLSGPDWTPDEEKEMVRAMTLYNKRVARGS